MLNDSQQLTVRVAVRRARENGTEAEEIKKLAAGMHVSEAEIRACTDSALGTAPAKRRVVWTQAMVELLTNLHDQGMGPAAIAKQMGMKPSQVQFKLSTLKLKTQASEDPTPAVVPAPPEEPAGPAEEPHPEDLPEELAESMEYKARHPEWNPSADPGPVSNDDSSSAGKQPELEPTEIDLARELMNLLDHFKGFYAAKARSLQVNLAAGWATCSFEAEGFQYTVSLKRRRSR